MSVTGEVIKIEQVGSRKHITIELPDPNIGLWYIGVNDPEKTAKRERDLKIYKDRIAKQMIRIGSIELIQ